MSECTPDNPRGWVVAPIEHLLAPLDDGRLLHHGWSPQCHKESALTDSEWGVLKTTSIQAGAFHAEHNKRLPSKLAPRPLLEVRPGDLLLTCAGPRARCGVPCLVRDTRPRLILSGKMYRFRVPDGLLDSRYLEAYLLTNTAQAAIDRMKTGISDSGLNLTHGRFKTLQVVVAPYPEQRRIVAAVESYFTRLAAAAATLERVQRNLKRYRASVLEAAVEGRLVPTEAELARAEGRTYEPASALLERILTERRRRWEEAELAKMKVKGKAPKDDKWKAKYVEPVAPDTSDLPGLPEGWCWTTVDQLAVVGTGATPRRGEPRFWSGGDVPWVTSAVVNETMVRASSEFVTHAALAETNLTLYPPGTLLIAMYGEGKTRGRATVLEIESTTNQALAALELPGACSQVRDWLLRFFEHNYLHLRRAASGGVQPNLNLGIVRQICVPLPPLHEQRRICSEADRSLSIALSVHVAGSANVAKVARLRQSILKWAFEGRLVDQDPTDKPASALLERIRADRLTARGAPTDVTSDSKKPKSPRRRKARTSNA